MEPTGRQPLLRDRGYNFKPDGTQCLPVNCKNTQHLARSAQPHCAYEETAVCVASGARKKENKNVHPGRSGPLSFYLFLCFCPSCPFSHSPSTCLSAPPEKKEYEESILSYHEANEKMQYLEELSTLQSKFQTQAFAASDPMWRRWILRHGTVVVFAPLLSSPCNTHPRPQNKRGGRGRNFLGSFNGHIFSGLSSLLNSM